MAGTPKLSMTDAGPHRDPRVVDTDHKIARERALRRIAELGPLNLHPTHT